MITAEASMQPAKTSNVPVQEAVGQRDAERARREAAEAHVARLQAQLQARDSPARQQQVCSSLVSGAGYRALSALSAPGG